jgi:hypothetical protein
MVENLSEKTIHSFITGDFKAAWNCIAGNSGPSLGRGYFMFCRQAMNLLEFVAMLCKNDSSGKALQDFFM